MSLRVFRRLVPPGTAALWTEVRVQKACIHGSAARTLRYGFWSFILGERTMPRLTRYSKIITVDGNLASGKGALAQKLADKLGMLYMPEPDTHYLDTLNGDKEPLPIAFNGMCSLEKFYREPRAADGNSYRLQAWMYLMRLLQYSNAVEHLLATGQGVILERSPFSDMVFLESMFKEGYIRKECVEHYNQIQLRSICEFLPPHLVIYLNVPVDDVQKTLKQSSKSYLHNVPLSYLKNIENVYKKTFLPQISKTSEVLEYHGAPDIDKVAEDFEYLEFDKGPWLEQDDVSFHHMRMFVEDKQDVLDLVAMPSFLPETTIGPHEIKATYYAYRSLPGKKYSAGYNADVGDKNIWFK